MFIINGETWRVVRVPIGHFALRRSDRSTTVASCDDNTKTIYILDNLSGIFLKKVLCHEITHAALFSYNVALDPIQEEIFADIVASYGDEIITITDNLYGSLN